MPELSIREIISVTPNNNERPSLGRSYFKLITSLAVGAALVALKDSNGGKGEDGKEEDRQVVDRLQAEGILDADEANKANEGIEERE